MDKIKIEDKSRIDKVTFLYPELMNKDSEKIVKAAYEEMLSVFSSLQDAREKVRDLEKQYKYLSEYFNNIKPLCSITFPYRDKEIIKEESSFSIRGHGNDIIGKTSVL